MDTFNNLQIKECRVDNPEELMLKYKQTGNIEIRNKLVMHYLQYVNIAIYNMRSILLSNIPFEDFFNQGIIALIDCIEHYDVTRGVATFDTYSYTFIRGAILKYLRKQNWLPNRLWEARKKISQGRKVLEQEFMREPTNKELASYLGISEDKLSKNICEISATDSVSFEELLSENYGNGIKLSRESEEKGVDFDLIANELHSGLSKAIETLPAKQKQIISLFYYENLNLREIGEVLDISQQRVSQLRKKALEHLKESLQDFT